MSLLDHSVSRSLSIHYVSLSVLQADPKNARLHDKRQIRQIAESIRAFGFNVPILMNAAGQIVSGHGRAQAAAHLGWQAVPVIKLEHLTPDQQRAFAIADNRLTEISKWDDVLLAENLRDLAAVELSFSIEATGFTMGEIDLRIESLAPAIQPDDSADLIPQAGPPVTRLGDLWQLGPHRILCGNALESRSYDLLLTGKKAHMVFTDPPYNVPINGHCTGLGQNTHQEFPMASGEMSSAEFTGFLLGACDLLARSSTDGSLHYICMDWRHAGELLTAGGKAYSELKNLCVWVKDNGGMGSLYRSQHELIFVFKRGKAPHRNNVELGRFGRYRTNVWNYPGANSFGRGADGENPLALHPTVKPVALIADAMLDCTARGDIVLDPFLGSGSTLLAAERVGRICQGMELDPLYVDLAIRRWQRLTGEQAVHVESGQTFNALEVSHAG